MSSGPHKLITYIIFIYGPSIRNIPHIHSHHPILSKAARHHRPPLLSLAKRHNNTVHTNPRGYRLVTIRGRPQFSPPKDTTNFSLFHIHTHLCICIPSIPAPKNSRIYRLHRPSSSHVLPPSAQEAQSRAVLRMHLQTDSENGETERLCPPSSHPTELRTYLHTAGLYRDPGHPNGHTDGFSPVMAKQSIRSRLQPFQVYPW